MARQVIETVVSDLSGKELQEGEAWEMVLTPPRGRSTFKLDLSEQEAQEFASKGREVKKRGREPGTKNKPKAS
jgi:hypothetical protein